MNATTLAVVVPTYGRGDVLADCLRALAAQTRPPDEVVVVTRRDDPASAAAARAASPSCTVVEIDEPGVLAAMVAGAHATHADVVAFTDDDAVPAPTWVAGLLGVLDTEAGTGAVGGRDVLVDEGVERREPRTTDVGRVHWYGRHVGNHHTGAGAPREVEFLKGVNAAYRRGALGLPHGLRGTGAQAHFEVAAGRFARRRGYDVVYDPTITVEHRPAPRQGDDQRAARARTAVADAAYNLVVAIGGARGLCRVAYATLLGDRGAPGAGRAAWALAKGDRATAQRFVPAVRGTLEGGLALLRGRGLTYETFL